MMPTVCHAEGERRKLAAHALLAARRAVYVRQGQRALLLHLPSPTTGIWLRHGTATADDVRAAVELSPGIDPRCLGTVPGPLARAGIIRRADYRPSHRAAAHARPVSTWELADGAAAIAWLATHPDMTDPEPAEPAHRTLWD